MSPSNLAIVPDPAESADTGGSSGTGDSAAALVNPWDTAVSQAAKVLRRSPATVRDWCSAPGGWRWRGRLLARKIGGTWMIHGRRLAAYLAEETP